MLAGPQPRWQPRHTRDSKRLGSCDDRGGRGHGAIEHRKVLLAMLDEVGIDDHSAIVR